MRQKRFFILVLLVLSSTAALCFFWPSDESRIRKLFQEGAAAVESRDLDGVMAKVSFNYRDDYGMSYLSLKEILKRELQHLSDISVEYEAPNIQVRTDTATVETDMRVIATAGQETGYIIGDAKTPVRLRFTLEKERTKWLVVKVEGFRQ